MLMRHWESQQGKTRLGLRGGKGPLHYVVVARIDRQQNFVFLNDPAQRKLFCMAKSQFIAEWCAIGRRTLVAVPKLPE